jgi:hypothetical protein
MSSSSSSSDKYPVMIGWQRHLSHAQIVPFFGVIPSVFKLALSMVQGSIGFCQCVVGVTQDTCDADSHNTLAMDGWLNIGCCFASTGYALVNIVTLSIAGCFFESNCRDIKHIF